MPQLESEILVLPWVRNTLGTVVCKGSSNKIPKDLIEVLDGHENPGINPYVVQEVIPDTEHAAGDPHAGKQDPLFVSAGPSFHVFHWHGDTFDLPEGAPLLASSRQYPHKAFRFGRCAYGLQFRHSSRLHRTTDYATVVLPVPGISNDLEVVRLL